MSNSDAVSKGARGLSAFLLGNGLTQAFAAKRLKCAESTLHDWLTGAKKPGASNRWLIERWTSAGTGKVNAVDWCDDGFLSELRALDPYTEEVES